MESARCKAFMYAADTGSFTKAAERLNYTPSGVSQLVGALENETGLTLLRRTRKGVTLTPDGEILLPAVREFLEKENRIYELAAEVKGLLVGSVTIAAYSSISTHWLPEVIRSQCRMSGHHWTMMKCWQFCQKIIRMHQKKVIR